jgi:hypothetical protein
MQFLAQLEFSKSAADLHACGRWPSLGPQVEATLSPETTSGEGSPNSNGVNRASMRGIREFGSHSSWYQNDAAADPCSKSTTSARAERISSSKRCDRDRAKSPRSICTRSSDDRRIVLTGHRIEHAARRLRGGCLVNKAGSPAFTGRLRLPRSSLEVDVDRPAKIGPLALVRSLRDRRRAGLASRSQMPRRLLLAALLLGPLAATAKAQHCTAYPPGPQRFACASARNPNLAAKLARCKEEGRRIGLSTSVKGGMGHPMCGRA